MEEVIAMQIDCTRVPEYTFDSSPRSMRFYFGDKPILDWWFEFPGEGTERGMREGRFLS